jgi:hypothetical protein
MAEEKVVEEKKDDVVKKTLPQPVKVVNVVTTNEKRAMMASFRHTTVTTVPAPICGENVERNSIIIKNLDTDVVWIGDRQVTVGNTGNGYPLVKNEVITIDKTIGEIYAVTAANSSVIAIIEE